MIEKQTRISFKEKKKMYAGKGRLIILFLIIAICVLFTANSIFAQAAKPDVSKELKVVKKVLSKPQLKAAMTYVDTSDQKTIQEWKSLCQAYGPSHKTYGSPGKGTSEIYRARLVYRLFRIYGLKNVHIDDKRNVIGMRPGVGDGPTVVLNAHQDNVSLWPKDQPIQAFVDEGRMWCPAAGDDIAGVVQMLTVLRALNAAHIKTKGDIWFVAFTGEEVGSYGARQFVRENYPLNLDWRNGDILVQFHGGGGAGVSTGSGTFIQFTQLHVFVPLDYGRWRTDAVDALAPIIERVNNELRNPNSTRVSTYEPGKLKTSDLLYMNMSMIKGAAILNGTSNDAWIRFDLRSPSENTLWQADSTIMRIAKQVITKFDKGFSYHYEVYMQLGSKGIKGFDKINNEAARYAAAASEALYGTTPFIDSTSGCGDCRRAYMNGMPGFSLRGNVIDSGKVGSGFKVHGQKYGELNSPIYRKTAGHTVEESKKIVDIWAAIKQGILFAVSYTGLAP